MSDLKAHGITPEKSVYWNSAPAFLYEEAIRRGQGVLADTGALVVDTTPYTGRSPDDRFIVCDDETEEEVWWGEVNKPFSPQAFDALYEKLAKHLGRQDLFVKDVFAGAEKAHALGVRVISESPWHGIFVDNMFISREDLLNGDGREDFEPGFTVLHAPSFEADPDEDETRSEAFVVISFSRRAVIIGGTSYGGEIKKSIFTVMNFLMPEEDVFPMHCSANVDKNGENLAVFFGLSATGKTTLSTDEERPMIGDDEHGWGEEGVFNFEGGSYAKVIRLSEEDEPLIYRATNQFGTIIENVVVDEQTRRVDYEDGSKTENTRSSYPLTHLDSIVPEGKGPHPSHIVFLSADAFSVLPPISRLTPEQAMYYFISGYTAKVAGTERGIDEPQAEFSPGFGAPFLPLHPVRYAEMLRDKIRRHGPSVWMINTGWTGGRYGEGERIELAHTRRMLQAALNGELDDVEYREDPVFGLQVPVQVPDVPDEVLKPSDTWERREEFEEMARELVGMFEENFEVFVEPAPDEVVSAGPNEDEQFSGREA